MKPRRSQSGFTMVELMFVVLLITILAGTARVSIQRVDLRTRTSSLMNDFRVFAEAFQRYALERGSFPADQPGAGKFPPNMGGYINRNAWMRTTPIGGTYDWDNINAYNSTRVRFRACLRVNRCNRPLRQLQQIDRWIDDGNIRTGSFRVTDAGATVLYVVEP